MPAITKSGNVLTKKPTKIEESNSVSFEYVINETTLLNKLKTVDGKGSGLDTDLVRGDYINPRMFKNRIINGDFSVWQRGEDFLFGTPDSWAASTSYSVGDIVIPTTANGYYYECTVAGTSGSSEPTWPTNAGDTVTDNNVETWAASTAYNVGDIRIPTSPNGYTYECTTAGTSGSSEPTWPTNPGDTVTDGDVVWTCRAQAEWVCKGVQYGSGGGYTADRIETENARAGGLFKITKSSFSNKNSWRIEVISSPVDLLTINYWYGLNYSFEGQHLYDLAINHKTVTISFWFKSNVTGKYPISLRNYTDSSQVQSYVTTFDYTTTDTPQKVNVSIPLNATWTVLNNDNLRGFFLCICFLSQGDYVTSTTDQWIDGNYLTTSDCVNWANTAGNYIEIAELQLEEGEVATEFEHVPYDIQLMRCMRYYWKLENKDNTEIEISNGYWSNGYYTYGVLRFPVKMRTKPTLKCSAIQNIRVLKGSGPSTGNTESLSAVMNEDACKLTLKKDTDNNMGGEGTIFYISASTPAWIAFDAEL